MELREEDLKNVDINSFIDSHMPFIIKTINQLTGRYVCLDNDEEISVALLAFNEAVKRYDNSKGPFLAYAKLVINSRLKTFFEKENKNNKKESLEKLREEGIDFSEELVNPIENKDSLIDEMDTLKSYINDFGFSLDDLVDEAPKHNDTRERAVGLGENISRCEHIKEFMYTKKRLPVKQVSLKYMVSEKIIKGSKKFIITVVIIFDKNLRNLKLWIRK